MARNNIAGSLNNHFDRLDYSGLSNTAGEIVPSRTPVDRIAMALAEAREVSARIRVTVDHLIGTKPESEARDNWGGGITTSQGVVNDLADNADGALSELRRANDELSRLSKVLALGL
ncbi:hypothetical protein [Rhizobium sp. Root651]|nr:hypothetical protein [Rhizobium sp. Root651]